jgi:iron(III) transport system ATP-binding protein
MVIVTPSMTDSVNGTLLRVRGVAKRFGQVVALDGFHLEVEVGEILALLGPSGCGKTTALRVLAGLERPDQGEVWMAGRYLSGPGHWVAPEHRRVGLVFQDWALFPHLDVEANVRFGLRGDRESRDRRVRSVLGLVGLVGYERRMPHELSGGQQQRVALARALAPEPRVVLLDEPFSNLDATLRVQVRSEVREVLRRAEATAILVTHDQEEALAIADRVAVMVEGQVKQVGTPAAIYANPVNREVAVLVGDANFLPGIVEDGRVITAVGIFEAPTALTGKAEVMVRPEAIRLKRDRRATARVEGVEFYGHDQKVRVRMQDGTVLEARQPAPLPSLEVGTSVRIEVMESPAVFGDRTRRG